MASVAAPSAETSHAADAGPIVFVRKRPEERHGLDACIYSGAVANACIDALTREPDPVRARYMRRVASAYVGRGPTLSDEVAECCNAAGACGAQKRTGHADCPKMDDGYACLVAAELGRAGAHARACQCDAARAQIPAPGGTLACEGSRPVTRAPPPDADDILACATCDAARGPSACDRELAHVDTDLAAFLRRVILTRCALP